MSRAEATLPAAHAFSAEALRAQFPALDQQVNGKPLAYLDNAATTQKPRVVIDRISDYYAQDNANVHRAIHELSRRATQAYEGARDTLARFIGANRREEIVFTRGTTDAINLVAQGYLAPRLKAGDEIVVSEIEHHSNIVPWQMLCESHGAILRVAPVDDRGVLDLAALQELIGKRTVMVAVGQVSNALGTVHPVQQIIDMAHAADVPVLVDGAQSVSHLPVDVSTLNADFFCFSAHKMFGPTGTGVLYGREALLESMSPVQGGGDMIETVSFDGSTWNSLPYKFEAGTPNIAGVIGMGAAAEFLEGVDLEAVYRHEHALAERAEAGMRAIPGLRIIGEAPGKTGIISFVMHTAHAQDVGTILDQMGVATRTGHHCAMPAMARFGVPATTRASFACYNTEADVDALLAGLDKVSSLLG